MTAADSPGQIAFEIATFLNEGAHDLWPIYVPHVDPVLTDPFERAVFLTSGWRVLYDPRTRAWSAQEPTR